MKKFILSLMCFFFVVFSGISHAITINTAQVGGKFYGLTGALNNPVVGSAITMGATALTKVNPWLNAISGGVIIYKIYEELTAGTVSVRPSGVSESVPTWAGNSPPSSAASLPGGTYYRISGYNFDFTYTTKQSAGDAECPVIYGSSMPGAYYDATNDRCTNGSVSGGSLTWDIYTAPTSCPAGYTLSGTTCNLSDASSVSYPSDGLPTYVVDVNGNFIVDPRDPDFTGLVTGLPGQNTLTQTAPNGDTMTLQGQPRGGFSVQTQHAEIDPADGLLHQYTQSATVNNAGSVTNYSTTNNVVNVVNGVATPATSGIDFPTDYARHGEAQTAANSVNAKLDVVHGDLNTPPGTDPALATEKNLLDTNTDAHKSYFDALGAKAQGNEGGALSYALPQPVEQDNTCTDPVVTVFSGSSLQKSMTITGYCAAILKVRSILGWLMYILTLYLLFDIVTGRKEEA